MKLSKNQTAILHSIADYMAANGRPPTVREIAADCDISSTSVVDYNLKRLVEMGYLRRDFNTSRGLRLTAKAYEEIALDVDDLVSYVVNLANSILPDGMSFSIVHEAVTP